MLFLLTWLTIVGIFIGVVGTSEKKQQGSNDIKE